MTTTTEIRCPTGPRKLFAKMRHDGRRPPVVDGNLIEFACVDCRKLYERETGERPRQVLHRYDLIGTLIETSVRW